jgi:DNA-directed RNA polymerase specialized sigma24 family protein
MDVHRSDEPVRSGQDLNGPGANSFDAFVMRTRSDLFRALAAHLQSEIATEALADAYAYAWKHWTALSTKENPTGYVYRIAERLGMRAEIRNRRVFSTEQLCELSDSETVNGMSPTDRTTETRWLEAYESDSSVIEILRLLPSRQRACVLLIHAYGWSYKQAAHTLDLPVTTVTNEATRGMARLRNNQHQNNLHRNNLHQSDQPQNNQADQSNTLNRDALPKRKSRRS